MVLSMGGITSVLRWRRVMSLERVLEVLSKQRRNVGEEEGEEDTQEENFKVQLIRNHLMMIGLLIDEWE